jgi:hypothetical protein
LNTITSAVWLPALSRLKPAYVGTRWLCGTGFSREDVGLNTISFAVWLLALSRLKPVLRGYVGPLWDWF